MADEDLDLAKEMLLEASKIAKTGTRSEYRNALKAVEDFAAEKGLHKLRKAVNKKRNDTS